MPSPTPPTAPRRDHVREHHGDRVVDPYWWMRDLEDPALRAYLEAENAYAEAMTEHLAPLRTTLFDEIRARVKEDDLSVPVASGPWWYFSRTAEGKQYAIHVRVPRADGDPRPDPEGAALPGEQVVLDGNVEAGDSEFFSLGALTVSSDHRLLAFAVDTAGDERFDLVVREVATGRVLDDALTGIGYGVELSRDGSFVFYTRVDDAWRPHQLWRHRVGGDPADDVLVHEETDERFWMGVSGSRDERWLLLGLGSKTTSEVWMLPSDDPEGEWRVVAPRREGVEYDVEPADDRLLVVHNADDPDSDLAWAPLDATSHEQWVPLLSSGDGERFVGVDAFDDATVLSLRTGGLTALRVLPRDVTSVSGHGTPWDVEVGTAVHSIGLGDNPEPDQRSVQVVVESWTTPRTVLDVDLATGARTELKRQPVLGGFDAADYEESREWATAPDGTQVPVSVVRRRGVVADGTNPGLLGAYGAYEISSDPYFSVARLGLLDRGVVFAVAHVRGGGEMGRRWYDEGKLLAKPNTFSDTVAAAEHLVTSGWVASDRLGLEGGSAGGLLVGAVVNAAPGLFRVAHAAVPFVDALTTILQPELPLTVGEWEEWGNPLEDPEVYAAMRAYTPYENVRPEAYPAILATTSLHDTRVYVTEPAKWVARLRETVTNDPATHPVLLRTELSAGHGGRSGRYAAWEQIAWEWAFVLDRLGATERVDGPETLSD
ncbi:S9 family peptidase [Phycicoccus sp. MAQZ13P-2]|uniref:S9 family peptidase n=1 Tax=Phycicoccus mangrovi TaxID=2840470 RepID=UPI001C002048|nr:S9 family peptidase [Phycicoccus mangrovi]MBT9254811.1 S9 family peptidase [Phycicoccus mangrovi]MBT9272984.1 S9 family peptidase [Phycicoccus mangrovi]